MERKFLQFPFPSEIKHGVSLRHGGVSEGPYASLNVGDNTGDDPKLVMENQRRLFEDLEVAHIAKLEQVHGTRVVRVIKPGLYQGDALITDIKDLALMIRHADCQAAIFYDREKEQIACVHAGWRGLVANIYREVVKALDTDPKKLWVAISPSLGPRAAFYPDFPRECAPFMEKPHYYNFWDLAEKQLRDLSIQNIHIERVCTYEHPEDYYSYRREKITGRHATLVCMYKKPGV